jgi:hypothetical protein
VALLLAQAAQGTLGYIPGLHTQAVVAAVYSILAHEEQAVLEAAGLAEITALQPAQLEQTVWVAVAVDLVVVVEVFVVLAAKVAMA